MNEPTIEEIAEWYVDGWDVDMLIDYTMSSLIAEMKEYPEFHEDLKAQYMEHNYDG